MRTISSRQNQVVAEYRAAARGDNGAGLLLDGVHLVAAALDAGLMLRHCLVAADAVEDPEVAALLARAKAAPVDVAAASTPVMKAVSPVTSPSPIVAIAEAPAAAANLFASTAALVVVACDVQEPGNLGAIVRVAEAGGAHGVIACGQSADPFGWKALRGSMGSALRLPIARHATAEAAIAAARQHSLKIAATVPRGGTSLFEADLTGAVAVCIGGEGSGLPSGVIAGADMRITIPMAAPVESLNAAVTAALVVYEAHRQRTAR